MKKAILVSFVVILGTAMALQAEFQVNTYTIDDQQYPAVAMDASGNFVIVWRSEGQDEGSRGIYGRRFDADGTAVGGEFQINTGRVAGCIQCGPSVAVDGPGNFVVTWPCYDVSSEGIAARRFSAQCEPLTDEFLVNTHTDSRQMHPSVAMNDSGEFVITWQSPQGPGYHTYTTGRKYDTSGAPYGPEFLITQLTNGRRPDVVIDDSGDFVVAWLRSGDSDDPPEGDFIRFRRYNSDTTPKGNAVQITDYVPGSNYPSIGIDGSGNFIITWVDIIDSYDICAQRFNANGDAIGGQFVVNTYRPEAQYQPSVAVASDGRFVVVWHGPGDGSDRTVLGRRYTSDGVPVGDEFQINTYITGHQWLAQVAMKDNGGFVTVWQSEEQDGSGYGIFAELPRKGIYYVDDDATGANNGLSWADAYYSLQDALADTWSGDEIRVAQGLYKPIASTIPPPPPIDSSSDQYPVTSAADRTATFQLKNGVVIKGGYAGFGEPNADARDIEAYETILSGDLNGDDVEVNDPCDLLTEPSRAENSYHVVSGSDCNESAVLDGFTITAGNANSEGYPFHHGSGGGIQIRFGSMEDEGPVLTNCTFIGNSARSGGGLDNDHCSTTLTNCTFIENFANWGGGIGNEGFPVPKLVNCTFTANCAGYKGGAIANAESRSTLENCTLIANHAELGGAIYNGDASAILTNCTLIGNSAESGGAVYNKSDSSVRMTNCLVSENSCTEEGGVVYLRSEDSATLINCILTANSAEKGSVLYVGDEGFAKLTSCTVTGNRATDNGGALYFGGPYDAIAIITNCIFWSNKPQEIYLDLLGNEIVITYNDVQGGWPGQGNIDADPCFVEPGYRDANGMWIDGDYHLLQTSACINAGDNNSLPADIQDLDGDSNTTEQIPYDLDGNPRIVYDIVDMGAYEFFNTVPVADAGPDQIVECACNTAEGTKVALDGANSSDPDHGVLTYMWTGPFIESPVHGAAPTVTLDGGCPGEYVITLVVNDGIEDSEPNEIVITVVDTTGPEFELSVSPMVLWPPNHKMVEITPSWTVSDECDASPEVSLVSVVANEGDDILGDGHTSDDIEIGDDGSIFVRSERSGTNTGRIYTITYKAVDDIGNVTVRSAIVVVPHELKSLARIGYRWLWRNHTGEEPERP